MTTPARSLRRLSSIQAGRAFAAILVVLYHNNTELFSVKKYWANTPIFPIFNFGHAGVEYFFVISGFIIFTVHHGDIGRASTAGAYVYKRIVRIYPVYWVVLFAVVIASFIFPYSRSIELSTFVSSFFLIATDTTDLAGIPNTIVLVAWTLYHEVMFYAIFLLLIVSRKFGLIAIILWLFFSALVFFYYVFFPEGQYHAKGLWGMYFSPLHILFGFGMLVAWLHGRNRILAPLFLTISGVIIFVGAGIGEVTHTMSLPPSSQSIIYGIGASLMILGGVSLERAGRLVVPDWLVFLGNASYSIYLTHQPSLVFIGRIVKSSFVESSLPPLVWYFLIPSAAVATGCLFHVAIERPILATLQSRKFPNQKFAINKGSS